MLFPEISQDNPPFSRSDVDVLIENKSCFMDKLKIIITNILEYLESIRLRGEIDKITLSTYKIGVVIKRIQNFIRLIGDDSVIRLIENDFNNQYDNKESKII